MLRLNSLDAKPRRAFWPDSLRSRHLAASRQKILMGLMKSFSWTWAWQSRTLAVLGGGTFAVDTGIGHDAPAALRLFLRDKVFDPDPRSERGRVQNQFRRLRQTQCIFEVR